MFNSLFRRAEATVDHALSSAVMRLIVAIPFLVAIGFATAAAASYLNRALGAELANLVLAATFTVIGLLAWAFARSGSTSVDERVELAKAEEASAAAGQPEGSTSPIADADILKSAFTAVGPIALPMIARLVMRNLPLLAALVAAGVVLTRESDTNDTQSMQPAE